MYEIVNVALDYGIPVAGTISLLLYILWERKIETYLRLHHPTLYLSIYLTKRDESLDLQEEKLVSEFISEKYVELNDPALSQIIFEYKTFKFLFAMFLLLFFVNKVMSHALEN